MIAIWNRKKIFTSFSMEAQAKVRDALDGRRIRYDIKVINRRNPSPFGTGTRSRTGSFGESASYMYEYILYVDKKDYELADRCIHSL